MQFSIKFCLFTMLAAVPAIQATPAARQATPFSDVARVLDSDQSVSKVNIDNAISPAADDVPVEQGELVSRSTLDKRTPGCLFWSGDSNWGGENAYFCLNPAQKNACIYVSDYWKVRISSFGPDPGTYCILYYGNGCTGTYTIEFTSPGYATLGTWNDHVYGFRCNW